MADPSDQISQSSGASGPEHRAHERLAHQAQALLMVLDDHGEIEAEFHVTTRDIAGGGSGVISANPVDSGKMIVLLIARPRGEDAQFAHAEVMHCSMWGYGWHRLGLRFSPMPEHIKDKPWFTKLRCHFDQAA